MNQLKEAEKKASLLVADARKARVGRMKEAKSEAEAAINEYRNEMEAKYQEAADKVSSVSGDSGSLLDNNTDQDIRKLTTEFDAKKASVEKMLCDYVCTVHVEAPKAREN